MVLIKIGVLNLQGCKIISPIPDLPLVFSNSAFEYSSLIILYNLFSPWISCSISCDRTL